MMKHALLRGSSTGLASIISVATTVGFLLDRREAFNLAPLPEASSAGYIWKRVFLKGKKNRAS